MAIALWIRAFGGKLATKSELTIALLGDHILYDHGEWLLSVPFLLGRDDLIVRILVGNHANARRNITGIPQRRNLGQIKVIPADFAGVEAALEEASIDLALVNGIAVLVDNAFLDKTDHRTANKQILAVSKLFSTVPLVGGISTSEAAFALDSGVLSAAGFGMETKPFHNEITVDGSIYIEAPYHTLWKVGRFSPPQEQDAYALLSARFGSILDAYGALTPLPGANIAQWGLLLGHETLSADTPSWVVGLPGCFVAEVGSSPQIRIEMNPGQLIESELLDEVIDHEPELRRAIQSWDERFNVLERMQWAADIFNRWIAPHMGELGPQLLAMAIDDHFEELAAGLIGDDTESDNPVEAELTEEFRNVLDEIEPAPLVALRSALTIAMEAIDELIEEQAHVEDEVIFRELLDRRMLAAAVHLLCDRPDFVGITNSMGETLGRLLAVTGKFDLLCTLLKEHDPRLSEDEATHFLMHLCIDDYEATGHEQEVVHLLAQQHANINFRTPDLATPLSIAFETGKWEVCKALCELGATLETKYFSGRIDEFRKTLPPDLQEHFDRSLR